jgi:Mlc titration factor MtfA (ptsG expression regulator)
MLVSPQANRRNLLFALGTAGVVAVAGLVAGVFYSLWLALALGLLAVLLSVLLRRRVWRRLAVLSRPFPPEHEVILQTHVAYYRALDEAGKDRFRRMAAVFLDEVRITGVRTGVDDTVRLLVAASAVIPVFGFHDWDYHRLGEVLIYPSSFSEEFQARGGSDENLLGMSGRGHLRGIMILSRPDLLAGFAHPEDKENVGVHEFTHEVEGEEERRGLPPEVPPEAARRWVEYVARELRHPTNVGAGINPYAYTNDHEYLAVLSEYFFVAPEVLKQKAPQLYDLLRQLFHQDMASLLAQVARPRPHLGRNDPCPCGSGKKFKECCRGKGQDES